MATALELDKPKVEAGPKPPEIGGEVIGVSAEEMARLLEMGQEAVSANGRRVENLEAEIPQVLAESNAGALEKGETDRLLGEVRSSQQAVEQTIQALAEQIPDQVEAAPPAEAEVPVVDLGGEPEVQSGADLEAEMLRLMAQEQEAQAEISAGLNMPAGPKAEVAPAITPTAREQVEFAKPVSGPEKKATTGKVLEDSAGSKESVNNLIKEKMGVKATAAPAEAAARKSTGPETASPPEPAPIDEEKIRTMAQAIYDKRESGEIAWDAVDALLRRQGIEPKTDQAKAFMKDWDWHQAEKIIKGEEPDDLVKFLKVTPEAVRKPETPTVKNPEVGRDFDIGSLKDKVEAVKKKLVPTDEEWSQHAALLESLPDEALRARASQEFLGKVEAARAEYAKILDTVEKAKASIMAKERLDKADSGWVAHMENIESLPTEQSRSEAGAKFVKELEQARQDYEKLTKEVVAGRVELALAERLQKNESDIKQAEKGLMEKLGRKIYEGQKWLEEKNLAKYLGESWQNKDTNTWLTKGFKGAVRLGARLASLRTVASVGMLGAGAGAAFVGGGMAAAGVGILGARRVFSTVATYYGAHDGMKGYHEGKNKEIMTQKLTPDELKNMKEDDLLERLGLFEIDAKMNKKSIREDENYKTLWQEMEKRMKYNAVDSRLDDLITQADAKRQEVEAKFAKKATRRKAIAAVLAIGVGSASYWLPSATHGIKGLFGGSTVPSEQLDSNYSFGPKGAGAAELEAKPKVELNLDDAPETSKAPLDAPSEAEVAGAAEHFDYQGGQSVWQEVAKQYEKRFPEFHDLPKGEQTYLIDQVKDKIAAHHDEFGLNDIDKVTADQLKAVDWDDAFSDAKLESPNLLPDQIANIEGPAGHEAMAQAEISPEADANLHPGDVIDKQMGIKGLDMEAEASPTVALEKSTQELIINQLHQTWAPDKLKAFLYLYEDEAARLVEKPDVLQSRLREFNDATRDMTERVVNGRLNNTQFEGSQAVLGADGKTYLIEGDKNKWSLWRVKEDGEFDQIQTKERGLFGKKIVDVFDGKKVRELLGYGPKAEVNPRLGSGSLTMGP